MLTPERYLAAPTFREYLDQVEKNRELWHALYERARVPDGVLRRVREMDPSCRLVALSEDWCGDAVNILPLVARLVEAAPSMPELRVLGRDDNPDLMDAHLTAGSRSIPVVMALDDRLAERGWWGPRPGPLQEWVLGKGSELESGDRYREVRRWYARDRGRTILDEILEILEILEPCPVAAAG